MILKDRHINFFADTPCNNFKCSDRMKIAPPRKVAPASLPAVPEGVFALGFGGRDVAATAVSADPDHRVQIRRSETWSKAGK
jgi:hypothetical protein